MEIRYFNTFSNELVYDINELSDLYLETNKHEMKVFVFGKIFSLLSKNIGSFFIGYSNGEKVSYGYYTDGGYDKSHKRLLYFAVRKKYLKQNYGYLTLKKVIEEKIDLDSGCMLSCNKSLQPFYEKIGFKFYQVAKFGDFKFSINPVNEIIMLLCSNKCNFNQENFGKFIEAEVTMKLLPLLIELQYKYNIQNLITPETIKLFQKYT